MWFVYCNRTDIKYRSENMKSLCNRYVLVTAILASIALGYKPADATPKDNELA